MVDAIENVSTAMTFGGSTYLERALDLVQSEIFTKRHGARDGVGRYVFILSDGLWSRPVDVMAKANFLKSKAQIYGIATGSQIKHSQLLDISTFDNVYPIGSPDVVHMIAKEIVFGCKGCSRRGTDVLLAFDLLWDNAYKEFETALDAGKLIINGLSLYPNGSDVSITTYGNDFKTIVSFNENKPKQALMQILNSKIKQEKTVSAMDESAFINNIETSFRSIRFAKKFDVTVVTIGVGWRTNIKNLLEISSDPAYTYVLGDEMGADETNMINVLCSSITEECNYHTSTTWSYHNGANGPPLSYSSVTQPGHHDRNDPFSENCETKVLDFCKTVLYIENGVKISRAHRVGEYVRGKTRPIVAKFVDTKSKMMVKDALRRVKLDYRGPNVTDQYPPEVNERRRHLVPIMKQARREGNRANLVRDKLYINNRLYKAHFPSQQFELKATGLPASSG
ncbi:hypothetical protein MAR_037102 [Mya arenaria]|uniref:VWFA domain-containing protein n=1 Tax=Mya arenaria TaxID=6604 RepID=A0ABY7FMK0_MYAAR|nr:hypothetical protein MAR_037102 [Mya arenaria]